MTVGKFKIVHNLFMYRNCSQNDRPLTKVILKYCTNLTPMWNSNFPLYNLNLMLTKSKNTHGSKANKQYHQQYTALLRYVGPSEPCHPNHELRKVFLRTISTFLWQNTPLHHLIDCHVFVFELSTKGHLCQQVRPPWKQWICSHHVAPIPNAYTSSRNLTWLLFLPHTHYS